MKENLNKGNFFNEMMERYPDATEQFSAWIDNYKEQVGMVDWAIISFGISRPNDLPGIKFHDLPFEMQKGIIHRFVKEKTGDDLINFNTESLRRDFSKVLEHIQDKVNLAQGRY